MQNVIFFSPVATEPLSSSLPSSPPHLHWRHAAMLPRDDKEDHRRCPLSPLTCSPSPSLSLSRSEPPWPNSSRCSPPSTEAPQSRSKTAESTASPSANRWSKESTRDAVVRPCRSFFPASVRPTAAARRARARRRPASPSFLDPSNALLVSF